MRSGVRSFAASAAQGTPKKEVCRLLAYVGPRISLQDLILAPKFSLESQSFSSRFQTEAKINADGFGVGWYDKEKRAEPARYRTSKPIWSEHTFKSMAELITSTAILAAIRNATPPGPVEESSTAPFTFGPWLFAHNGSVKDFFGEAGTKLRRKVSDARSREIVGTSDSEVLFALTLDALDEGLTPAKALQSVIDICLEVTTGRFNLMLHDGRTTTATAWGNSLFHLKDGAFMPGSFVIASEPFDDDPRWHPIPDGSVVEASSTGITIERFGGPR